MEVKFTWNLKKKWNGRSLRQSVDSKDSYWLWKALQSHPFSQLLSYHDWYGAILYQNFWKCSIFSSSDWSTSLRSECTSSGFNFTVSLRLHWRKTMDNVSLNCPTKLGFCDATDDQNCQSLFKGSLFSLSFKCSRNTVSNQAFQLRCIQSRERSRLCIWSRLAIFLMIQTPNLWMPDFLFK